MVETFGDKDALLIEVEWSEEPASTATEATRGALRLWAHGRLIWPASDFEGGLEWTWIELAEWLAGSWPFLVWETGLPLELRGGSISEVHGSLDRRWRLLSMAARETEEEDLYSFAERHDLARALMGATAPAVWIYREGNLCWVSTHDSAVLVPFTVVEQTLQEFVDAAVSRLATINDGRATAIRSAWNERSISEPEEIVAIATGMEIGVLSQLQGDQDTTSFWEFDDHGFAMTELLAVARLAAPLPTTDTAEIIAVIRSTPRRPSSVLDKLSRLAREHLPASQDRYPYDQGYIVADWLRMQIGIDPRDPVNPEHLLESWGVQIRSIKLGTSAVDAVASWGPRHGPAVIINSTGAHNQSKGGERATYAHEVAHLLLDRTSALPLVEVMGGRAVGNAEERARAFAAQLLLPKEEAGRELEAASDPARAVDVLQRRYGVSREIIAWQARNSDIQLSSNVHAVLRRFVSRPWRF